MNHIITIKCKDRTGQIATIKTSKKSTIKELKEKISEKTGIHFEKIVLKRGPHELRDYGDLDLYEVTDGCCLEMYYK